MQPGDVIDHKYRIEALLGEGGMGRVFAATHVTLDATFAIKVLKREALSHAEVPHRFMREARAASRLRNEHVVRVSDIGQLATGEPYMVMEMLHGYDLATRLQKGALEPARAVEYIVQACEGLAEAHAHGMVHRDIKPANLFVTTRPNGAPLIKLLDFGIATAAIGDIDHRLTTTQSVIGSPSYMSPEQLRATKDVDARSDIWSLGVTLYELLADRQPFVAPTITALSLKIVSEPHVPIADIPDALMAVVDRCLEKEREARFANVAALAAALAPFCPDGKLAADMVSGMLKNPVPPTLESFAQADQPPETDPSSAGWRLPSAPASMTTTGFAAGESAALAPAKKRRARMAGWIALAAAAASGGIATAIVLGLSSREAGPAPATSPTPTPPAATSTTPPASASPAPPASASTTAPSPAAPPSTSTAAASTSPAPPATTSHTPPTTSSTSPASASTAATPAASTLPTTPVATKPAKRPTRPKRPSKPSKPATTTSTTTTTTTTVPPPVEPPPAPKPPAPKPPAPCDPSDKTCGL